MVQKNLYRLEKVLAFISNDFTCSFVLSGLAIWTDVGLFDSFSGFLNSSWILG
jgi:hypothetical protein